MQPQIRYAKSPDGVSIAYTVQGTGPALVYLPPTPVTHVELEWSVPEMRAGLEGAASMVRFVRYDSRGFGLSTRDNVTFSLEALESDLGTVIEAIGLRSVSLMATGVDSMTAIAYAAHHPERVTALVLNIPVADGADAFGSRYDTILNLARTDWPSCVELFASTSGRGTWIAGNAFIEMMNAAMTQAPTVRYFEAMRSFTATELLGRVQAPTLVIGRRELSFLATGVFRAGRGGDTERRASDARGIVGEPCGGRRLVCGGGVDRLRLWPTPADVADTAGVAQCYGHSHHPLRRRRRFDRYCGTSW